MRAKVLCDNSVFLNVGAIAEHGWAVHLDTGAGRFLWDTGQGAGLLPNAAHFGIDLATLDATLISHHHLDHTGGLKGLLSLSSSVEVYAHPELFKDSYRVEKGMVSHIGMPFKRSALEGRGATFHLLSEFIEVAPRVWMTGEIPRVTDFETGDACLMIRTEDGFERDRLMDDQALVVEGDRGVSVILGCCHAGLINTLRHIAEHVGTRRFHVVMGGTHLGLCSEEQLNATIKVLREFEMEKIGVSHCTGTGPACRLAQEYGDRFFFCSVGTEIEL
jgi:7,8-dihydropterin-6-yl-methyl-4-(beta-D-ribofuranosyl)aminobenzene 5'-phosphate synthase